MTSLSLENALGVRIQVDHVTTSDSQISFTAKIWNDSPTTLTSAGPQCINLAWFVVDDDDQGPWLGDFGRIPITVAIASGTSASQVCNVAFQPCDAGRTLVVTLVAEGAFWFHLSPIGRYARVLIPKTDRWWDDRQARGIAFSSVADLNHTKFQPVFGQNGKGRPLFLHLETVNICNLKCLICPYISMQRDKETMSSELFDNIISDYIEMGGGDVGLTPSVGDIFLDKKIVERVRVLRQHPEIRSIGFVTNAGNAGVLSNDDLSYVINECTRINISVYGLDEEENAAMTRRPGKFNQIQEQIERIIDLNQKASVVFAFRLLKENAKERAQVWMLENFGSIFSHEVLTTYGNWGGAVDIAEPLPFQGGWLNPQAGTESVRKPCAYPGLHLKVAVNGDVKFCSCIDFDSLPENIIGNVKYQSLSDIYNGLRAKQLWSEGLSICSGCTHYKSVDLFSENIDFLASPIQHLGI